MTAENAQLKIAVIGAGKMGGILLQAFLKEKLFTPDKSLPQSHTRAGRDFSPQWGIAVSTDNLAAVKPPI